MIYNNIWPEEKLLKGSILYILELSLIYLYKFGLLTNPNNNLLFLTPNSHSDNIFVSLLLATSSSLGIKPIGHTILMAIVVSIVRYIIRIVSCVKNFRIVSAYHKRS